MKKIKKVFIVPYCHADWAWTHTRNWHEKRYNLVFNEVLDIIKEHLEFRWYLDNYICELEPFLRYSKNRIPELRKRIKQGKIAVCGGFANIRPNMVGEETFIRNLILGRRKFQELFPEIDLSVHADIVDVGLGHPNMPQVLSLAGYKYFRFWRPEVALNLKKIPREFIWEGLNGSKILVSRGCYGGLISKEVEKDIKRELEYRSCLSLTGLIWLSQGMDDSRPLRTVGSDEYLDLFSFIKDWNEKEKEPMVFATPIEFYRELEKEDLPIIKGTLDPCDVCYNSAFAGARGLWKLRLETDRELTEAEMWSVVASKTEVSFQGLWENLLAFSSHGTQWLLQEDFDEIYNLALRTKWQAGEIKKEALKMIVQRINFPEKTKVIVFNQLPFPRGVILKIFLSFPDGLSEFSLKDGQGKKVPFQIINEVGSKGWEVELLTKINLPSFGYNTLTMKKKNEPSVIPSAKPNKNILENDKLRISFQNGKIVAIKDKFLNKEYKSKKDLITLKAFDGATIGPLHVGKTIKEYQVCWQKGKLKETGPLRWSYLREGKISFHSVKQNINLHPGESRIEFETEVFWQGADSLLTFTTALPFTGNLTADIPFGIESKNLSEEPYGKATGSGGNIERMRPGAFFTKSFVDWNDGKKGMAYINYDGDRYYTYNENDKTLNHILINGILETPGWEKDVNREVRALGYHCFKSALVFHPGDWKRAKIYKQALSLRSKPEVFYPDEKGTPYLMRGNLSPLHSFLAIEPENLILTAFYQEERFYILRFFEAEGKETKVKIKLPFKPKKVRPIDFIGQELKEPEIKVEKDSLSFLVKPYKIITLKMN